MSPRVQVQTAVAVPAQVPPTDTGTGFFVAPSAQGPAAATLVQSLDDEITMFGARQPTGSLYDAMETFFKEGGSRAYVIRATAAAALSASKVLKDTGNANVLTLTANGPGVWGNALTVDVITGLTAGAMQIVVKQSGTLVEQSPDLLSANDAVAWINGASRYLLAQPTGTPTNALQAATAQALTGGSDGTVADSDYIAALARIPANLGPGQISAPGRTGQALQLAFLAHAHTNNRFAVLDATDTATVSTLVAQATSLAGADAPYGGLFCGWTRAAGIAPGTPTRLVPPSASVMGRIAKVDASQGPATPAAGVNGILSAQTVNNPITLQADLDALDDGHVNPIVQMLGGVRIYGWETLANPSSQPLQQFIGQVRLVMGATAEFQAAGEEFAFIKIDGRGKAAGQFALKLDLICSLLWESDQLFGNSKDEAYYINVGPLVNTLATIAKGQLKARVGLKVAPDAEHVIIEVVQQALTDTFAGGAAA